MQYRPPQTGPDNSSPNARVIYAPLGVLCCWRRLTVFLALALLLFSTDPEDGWAQNSRIATDKLLQAEQSILSSLSARAVSFSDPQAVKRLPDAVVEAPRAQRSPGAEIAPTADEEALEETPSSTSEPKTFAVSSAQQSSPKQAAIKVVPLESLSQMRTANALLRSQLEQRDLQVAGLTKQVQELQSQLTIAEVEVERLSAVMDAKVRASLGQYKITPPSAATQAAPRVDNGRNAALPLSAPTPSRDVQPPSPDSNLEVATVAVQKAELRLGPGNNHSALLSLPGGSRLAVEMRQGSWLRVFAPSGERAWIHASLVRFGESTGKTDGSAVAVKGFSTAVEDEAFRRFQRGSGVQ